MWYYMCHNVPTNGQVVFIMPLLNMRRPVKATWYAPGSYFVNFQNSVAYRPFEVLKWRL